MSEKKKIYVAVTQTGTILSRIVKWVTRDKYNHVSISLTKDLSDLYSFGRKNPYNPFRAGFVKESPTSGTFGRFYKTEAVIVELEVEGEVYDELSRELSEMYENRDKYKYNYIGLFAGFFGKTYRRDNIFYCSEFVQYILKKHGLGLRKGDRELVCPNDFVNLQGGKIIYTGRIRAYGEALTEKAEETKNEE